MLPKAINRIHTMAIKIPTQFLTDMEIASFNFIWKKQKKSQDNKNTSQPDRTSAEITIAYLKVQYRALVIKMNVDDTKKKEANQRNRHEDPDIIPHTYGYLIFDKEPKS